MDGRRWSDKRDAALINAMARAVAASGANLSDLVLTASAEALPRPGALGCQTLPHAF